MTEPLKVLIVDDEAPARARMRDLLNDIAADEPTQVVAMVANGEEALRLLDTEVVDVVFADVRMPVMDGVEFARRVIERVEPPGIIFTTAYDEYAVTAFDVAAVDYLLKPVRASRLSEALGKMRRSRNLGAAPQAESAARQNFSVTERGRILLVPVDDVRYLKAELRARRIPGSARRGIRRTLPAHPPQLSGCPGVGAGRRAPGRQRGRSPLGGAARGGLGTPLDQPPPMALRQGRPQALIRSRRRISRCCADPRRSR